MFPLTLSARSGSSIRFVLVTKSTILGSDPAPSPSPSSSPSKRVTHTAHYYSRGQKALMEAELAAEDESSLTPAVASGETGGAGETAQGVGVVGAAVEPDTEKGEGKKPMTAGWEGGFP